MTAEKMMMTRPMTRKRIKLIPPDGGWGWMVVVGTALSNIFNQSMLSLFSLLYGDKLEEMGHDTKGAAIVLSTMLFVTNFGGPLAATLLKLTSPRLVAVLGACFCTIGIFCSAFSTNIWHLILTYGVSLGLGLGFIQNSSFVVINSYFKLKKSRAVGLANVGTGVGQMLMPHLVTYLLRNYGFSGTCLVLSGLSLHGIAGTYLLQPVEWHMKEVEEEIIVDESIKLFEDKHKDIVIRRNSMTNGVMAHNGGRRSTEPFPLGEKNGLVPKFCSQKNLHAKNYSSVASYKNGVADGNNEMPKPAEKSLWQKITDFFDLSLLSSPRFLNVIFGTALAVTSIQNFSLIYPKFLQKVVMMDMADTATCMSVVAGADIVGRLVLPTFQDRFRITARWMLVMTCAWLIVVRQILAYQKGLYVILLMSALYGFGRSMIIVARNIAISDNCRQEQVPAAVGLGMFTMGLIVPPTGYFLGWIRDKTNSYVVCISAQNVLLMIILAMWIPDLLHLWREERRMKKKQREALELS